MQHDVTAWQAAVTDLLKPYLHQVAYGNLRAEHTRWDSPEGSVDNLAIVYEVPGGSTNQLNISYAAAAGTFAYLDPDTAEECHTSALAEILAMVEHAVAAIPHLRRAQLYAMIDRWIAAGMGRSAVLQELNRLLQATDLPGGTLTPDELKLGIAYLMTGKR